MTLGPLERVSKHSTLNAYLTVENLQTKKYVKNFIIIIIIIAQSRQAKNCKLGVTSEMTHSLAQKLFGCESVSERYFISSLQ